MKTSNGILPVGFSRSSLFVIFLLLVLSAAPSLLSDTTIAMQAAKIKIHNIQGSGAVSPLASQTVTTSGIITAIKNDGFFIQEPNAGIDSNSETSEGIFVFTQNAPPLSLAAGDSVDVTGAVVEFRPQSDPLGQPLTEISNPSNVTVLSKNNALPAPVALTADDLDPAGPLNQLEKFEGMRVVVHRFNVVAPTGGEVDESEARSSPNGIFYGVISGTPRPFREAGIEISKTVPAPAPPNVPRFDSNPELLRVDSGGQRGVSAVVLSAFANLLDLTGVLDFSSRAYTILLDRNGFDSINTFLIPGFLPQSPNGFSVASFNLGRFFDATDDGSKNDVVLKKKAFRNRLNKASLAIRISLALPDIIGVQEVENLATLQELADKINDDQVEQGSPNPRYTAHLVEGSDSEGLDVGFLFKSSRAAFVSATQIGKEATFISPISGQPETLNDRPPLRLRAAFTSPAGASFPVTVIVSNLLSRLGIDDETDGARVRAKRRAQAEFLANLLQVEQVDTDAHVIAIGDFNSFQFNDGYVDVMGTVTGHPTPADQVVLASNDLVNPDFVNITDRVSAANHYSVISEGNAQALDHILASPNMSPLLSFVTYSHLNADIAESVRNDETRPQRVSDHDVPIAYFSFAPISADLSVTFSGTPGQGSGGSVNYMVILTNHGPDIVGDAVFKDSLSPFDFNFFNPISPGSQISITGLRFLNAPVGSTVTSTITVKSNVPDPDPSNNSVTFSIVIQPLGPRILSARIEGKKLILSGNDFEANSVIEIDGESQKTTFQNSMFSQILTAKKGGKKIKPGEQVTLTVVNSDGKRSPAFPFTR
ncbi:MAG: endonuclease/exonuclease/phosphatase family protein [Blastocatellia bacterium]